MITSPISSLVTPFCKRAREMPVELLLAAEREQCRHRDQAAVALRQAGALPDIAVDHGVGNLGEFRHGAADGFAGRRGRRCGHGWLLLGWSERQPRVSRVGMNDRLLAGGLICGSRSSAPAASARSTAPRWRRPGREVAFVARGAHLAAMRAERPAIEGDRGETTDPPGPGDRRHRRASARSIMCCSASNCGMSRPPARSSARLSGRTPRSCRCRTGSMRTSA